MKAFLAAVLTVVVISFGASVLLETFQRTADNAFTGPGARIDVYLNRETLPMPNPAPILKGELPPIRIGPDGSEGDKAKGGPLVPVMPAPFLSSRTRFGMVTQPLLVTDTALMRGSHITPGNHSTTTRAGASRGLNCSGTIRLELVFPDWTAIQSGLDE